MEIINDLALIVVFYNPSLEQIQTYSRIAKKFHVIAVDNSKGRVDDVLLGQVEYIPLYSNYGIAKAQNEGIRKAIDANYRYLLFFDQDSSPNAELIYGLYRIYKQEKKRLRIGALGPANVEIDEANGYSQYNENVNDYKLLNVDYLISSGTITSVDVIDKVGGFEDKLFIDCVDFEWCWRIRKEGYNVFVCNNISLPHKVGQKIVKFCGFPVIISAPFRYYFKTRNTIVLLFRKYVPFHWKLKSLVRLFFTFFYVIISDNFKSNKKVVLVNIIRGIKDSFYYSYEKNFHLPKV